MTSKKAEIAHKGAGWTGVAIALISLISIYLERDASKQQAAAAAASVQVNVSEAVDKEIQELGRKILVTMTLLQEREKEVQWLRDRLDRLEDRASRPHVPASRTLRAPASSAPAATPAPSPPAPGAGVTNASSDAAKELRDYLTEKEKRRKRRASSKSKDKKKLQRKIMKDLFTE